MRRLPIIASLAVVLLTGCGSDSAEVQDSERTQPITPEAIGAIVDSHLDQDLSMSDTDDDEKVTATSLRYGGDGESDGDLISAAVTDTEELELPSDAECRSMPTDVADAELCLYWEEEEPEEDPGLVVLVLDRGEEMSAVLTAGDAITGDPREMDDLTIPVETMQEIVEDELLRSTTTQDAIDEGKEWAESH